MRSTLKRLKGVVLSGLAAAALSFAASQMTCAEAVQDWGLDPIRGDGGTSDSDGGGGPWRCFTGTATNDEQFLNHCTEAERVERLTYVPIGTWDPKDPLPQTLK